jgi:hypothetical protein
VPEENDRYSCESLNNEVVDDLGIRIDLVPATGICEVTELIAVTTVSPVVVYADGVAALSSGSRKTRVAASVFAKAVQHLNDNASFAFRLPQLHVNVVAVGGGQNLVSVM